MPMYPWDDELSQRFLVQVRWFWSRFHRHIIIVFGVAVLAGVTGYAIENRTLSSTEILELEQEIEENLRQNLFDYPPVEFTFEVKVEACTIRLTKDIRDWCSNSSLVTKTDQLIVMNEVERLWPGQLDDRNIISFRFPSNIVAHREFTKRFYVKHRKELTSRRIKRNITAATTFTMDSASREAKAYLEGHNIRSYKYLYQCHGGYGMNPLPFDLSLVLKKSTPSSLLKSIETYRKQCHQLD